MRRGPTWIQLGVVFALVIALAMVSPALGGPSLKDLVQQEVTKQLNERSAEAAKKKKKVTRGSTGPAGPQGSAGSAGAAGSQGPGALRLDFDQPETDAQVRQLGTINELTISAGCETIAGFSTLTAFATSNGIAGTINASIIRDVNSGYPATPYDEGHSLAANTQQDFFFVPTTMAGESVRSEVQAVYRNANRVVTLQLHAVADDGTGRCQVQGAAVPAN